MVRYLSVRFALLFSVLSLLLSSFALVTSPVCAADQAMTVNQALEVLAALRNLDAHPVIVKQNGSDSTVMLPWEFGSGALRLKIANDLTILTAIERAHEEARQGIVKEIFKGKPGATEIKPGTPEMDEYVRQFKDLGAQPAQGAAKLTRISATELRLDKNEIPSSVLAALGPILDQ